MINRELKIGIVGCGGISRFHARAYAQTGQARITHVYDVHAASADAFASEIGAASCASILEMAQESNLDAVSVCTPPGAHLENCLPFIEAGIPILCEKPLAATLDQALQLEDAIRRSGTPFMIGFCHRFHPAIVKVKQMLSEEAEAVGKPLFFRNLFGGTFDLSAGHRGDRALSGGGALIDNCAHALDLFRFLMGEVECIQAQVKTLTQPSDVEDFASIGIIGSEAVAGQIAASYSLPVVYNSVEIFCSESTLSVNYGIRGRPDLAVHYMGDPEASSIPLDDYPDRFVAEITNFLNCVLQATALSPGIDDAIANARLIDEAYRSAGSLNPQHSTMKRELNHD